MENDNFNTRVAYRDDNSWTSERGASKFIDQMIQSTEQKQFRGHGAVLNGFKVTPGNGMQAVVNNKEDGTDGHIVIKYNSYCYLGWIQEPCPITISGSDQALPRITLIVAYIDLAVTYQESDKVIEAPTVLKFKAVDGIPNNNPAAPSIATIQSEIGLNNPYVVLASILVQPNTGSISDSNITDYTQDLKAKLSDDMGFDPENTYVTGILQPAPNKGVKTRIVVTGPDAATPAAIPDVELIWLRKKR